jgi:hypothetical protein
LTFKEMEHLDYNVWAIALVLYWDNLMWWVTEMQRMHNALHGLKEE